MTIDLPLGPRPNEPAPPIGGPSRYPDEVRNALAADADSIIAKYPQSRSALLPLLHLVQSQDGYLTSAGIHFCAERLGLSEAEVAGVATFYSMYRRTPTGEYLVGVCTNTLCAVMGGDAILERLQEALGIHAGQTTSDGKITLEHIECNAACDYAPVVMANWAFYDNQTPDTATDFVESLRGDQPVPPTRGTLCSFRQTARTLAGVGHTDDRGGAPGLATLAGLRASRESAGHLHDRGQEPTQDQSPTASGD